MRTWWGAEIGGDDTVLDIGCGDGASVIAAGRAGAAVIAADVVDETIQAVRKKMASVPARHFEAHVSDCNPIPIPDESCTVVIAQEVLEHVWDPEVVIREMVRVGRPGCRYLITVPHPASESLMRTVAYAEYFQAPNHVRIFEPDQLKRIVRSTGLEITQEFGTGFYWAMWWALKMAHGPAVSQWESCWAELQKAENAAALTEALDKLIPKSIVLVCRKP